MKAVENDLAQMTEKERTTWSLLLPLRGGDQCKWDSAAEAGRELLERDRCRTFHERLGQWLPALTYLDYNCPIGTAGPLPFPLTKRIRTFGAGWLGVAHSAHIRESANTGGASAERFSQDPAHRFQSCARRQRLRDGLKLHRQ